MTYKVEKNHKYGDYRVALYIDGELWAEYDDNWSKAEATKNAKYMANNSGLDFFI